jgi:hypothetical protein
MAATATIAENLAHPAPPSENAPCAFGLTTVDYVASRGQTGQAFKVIG